MPVAEWVAIAGASCAICFAVGFLVGNYKSDIAWFKLFSETTEFWKRRPTADAHTTLSAPSETGRAQ